MRISNSSRPRSWWHGLSWRWLPGAVLAVVLAGCGEPPQIEEYTVAKPDRQPQPAFDHPPMQPMRRPPMAAGPAAGVPDFDVPESWQKIPNPRMSVATFQVKPDDKDTLVTLIPMAPLSDSLLRPNVDRWRGQVGLDPLKPSDDPKESFETVPLADGSTGRYLKLVGEGADDPQAMLTLIATEGGRTWYFKLMGNAEVVLEEEPRFKAFVQSVRFSPNEEAGDE